MILNPYRYASAPGGAPFDFEADVASAGIVWWMEAGPDCEVSSGVPATEGQSIEFWRDKSSNGNDWSQSNASYRPLFDADAGAKFNNGPAVYFNGAAGTRAFGIPDISAQTAGEIFILYYLDSNSPSVSQTGFWNMGTALYDTVHPWTDGKIYDSYGTNARKSTGNPVDDLSNSVVMSVTSKSGLWQSRINGTSHYSTATNAVAFPSNGLIGVSKTSASYRMQGRIKACVFYNAEVSAGDRTNIYNAFSAMRS